MTSCAFADALDASTGRLQLRSCLVTEGCSLTIGGACLAASNDSNTSLSAHGSHPVSSRRWPLVHAAERTSIRALAVSYCTLDDPICLLCRSMFKDHARRVERSPYQNRNARSNGGLLCRGRQSCLWLEACEAEWALKKQASSSPVHYKPSWKERSSGTASGHIRRHPASHPRVAPTWWLPESCEYLGRQQNTKGCRPRRPCIDCLL
ncbi:hypothetical protein ATCC90586_011524 [Pythium insidiosum]|nr:hypothetical protein ATCC90586_011524 [Pythium insidiosum]